MGTCVFFGNADAPDSVRPLIRETIVGLIERGEADVFLVGNQGRFDAMVRAELRELSRVYPQIYYAVMLAYMPEKTDREYPEDMSDTVYPEGLETVPLRFAIDKRNRMMLARADIVVTYTAFIGNTRRLKERAERKGKRVIELYVRG